MNLFRLCPCWLLFALPLAATAQEVLEKPPAPQPEIVGQEKIQLLASARSQYYNLRTAGLKSFGCTVKMDWSAFMLQVTGTSLPADDPTMKYLSSSRLGFSDDLDGKPVVKWAFSGTPPDDKTDATGKMTNGLVEVVQSFLQAWTPSQDGTLISLSPRSFKRTAAGFQIEDAGGTNLDLLTLDKDFVITHVSDKNPNDSAESDFAFEKSPQGLVLTQIVVDDHTPPTAPSTHVTMSTTYAPVDSFLLPEKVTVNVRNVATFSFAFTSCAVTRQP